MSEEKCDKAAIYYRNGIPYSYSLFRAGQEAEAGPVGGIYPEITDFHTAWQLFEAVRKDFHPDGRPKD